MLFQRHIRSDVSLKRTCLFENEIGSFLKRILHFYTRSFSFKTPREIERFVVVSFFLHIHIIISINQVYSHKSTREIEGL